MNKLLELKSLKGQNQKGEIWVLEKNLALLVKRHFFIPSTPLTQKNIETGSQCKTFHYMAVTLLQMTECNNYCIFNEATVEKLRKGWREREYTVVRLYAAIIDVFYNSADWALMWIQSLYFLVQQKWTKEDLIKHKKKVVSVHVQTNSGAAYFWWANCKKSAACFWPKAPPVGSFTE